MEFVMKVKLIEDFGSHRKGSEITMHPYNARIWFKRGVCTGVNEEETEFLRTGEVPRRMKRRNRIEPREEPKGGYKTRPVVETQMEEGGEENALRFDSEPVTKPRKSRKRKQSEGVASPA